MTRRDALLAFLLLLFLLRSGTPRAGRSMRCASRCASRERDRTMRLLLRLLLLAALYASLVAAGPQVRNECALFYWSPGAPGRYTSESHCIR